jgi:hypothetical protein
VGQTSARLQGDGIQNRGMICGEPQMPAALLIGSNSESFGSNLHTTTISRPDMLWPCSCAG